MLKSGKQDIFADIQSRIERIPQDQKTDSNEYHLRLVACGECEYLIDGVCLKCGCYPEFRAAFSKNRCPNKKW
ncbi:MAG: DUF6171 family protein [Clostridia bacterium]|nr:DUF6171 family protein [Clostridia bacterium]